MILSDRTIRRMLGARTLTITPLEDSQKFRHEGKVYSGLETLSADVIKDYDLVIITTAHTKVDYAMVAACGVPVFDCKNVCKNVKNQENIEVL